MDQREVWEEIAKGWGHLKNKPMDEVIEFANELNELKLKGKILDVGCGNGRNLIPFAKLGFECYGIDFSKNMIEVAKKKFEKLKLKCVFKVADARNLPFEDESFDYVICVAVLHHLKKSECEKALSEIKRVLKTGGRALLTVWNKYSSFNLDLILKPKEAYIPWRKKDKTYMRYYYLYNWWEFKDIVGKYFSIEKSGGIFDRNIKFEVRK
jgi:ubiquinone/menaquinone biosynthesis C-methylase UbiE